MLYTYDMILNMIYGVDPDVRQTAVFVCGHREAMDLRKITDTDGRFVWQDAPDKLNAARLFGYPVYCDDRYAGVAFGLFMPLPPRRIVYTLDMARA